MNRTIQTLLVMMGALSTISATDIFLPSLPSMALYFGVSENEVQLAVPLYMVGSLLVAPFLGDLSDKWGRRPVMLSGFVLFLFGTALCFFSTFLPIFLIGRFLQGFGSVVAPVVGWAIIQDLYPPDESPKIMSWIGAIISMGPFIAPGLGGYVHIAFGWRGNFALIFIFVGLTLILMFFSISKQHHLSSLKKQEKTTLIKSLKIYNRILKDKPFVFYVSLYGFLSCGQWCYLTLAPFYFENVLQLSPKVFGLYLSISSSFFILGTMVTPFLLNRLGSSKTLQVGALFPLVGAVLMFGVSVFYAHSILLIVLPVGFFFFGQAITWGPSTSRALHRFNDIRGAASGLRTLTITGSFALGGFMGSLFDDSSLLTLSFFLFIMAVGCWFFLQRALKLEA